MKNNGGIKRVRGADRREVEPPVMTFRMRQIVQLLPEGVLLLDRRGRILEGNAKATELLGIDSDLLVGDELERLFLGARREDGRAFLAEDLPGRRALLSGVPQTGVTMAFELRSRETLWLEVDAIPLGSIEDDGPVVLVSFRDISAHRRMNDAVTFQAGLLDAAAEAIIATDRHLRITYCNAGTERLVQRSREETLGELASAFVTPERRADVDRIEHLLISGLVIRDFETVIRRADGTEIDVSMSVTCQTSASGEPTGAIAIIRDISDRVRAARTAAHNAERAADAERQAAREAMERAEAERANDAKTELLSRVSHELRTPLNSVLGFAQLLEDAELADPVDRRSVAEILQAGGRLLGLIDEVLEGARAVDENRSAGLPASIIDLDRPALAGGRDPSSSALPPGDDRREDRELTILVVDDDLSHLRAVEAAVGGRDHVNLVTTPSGRRGIELAHALRPDLLLLSSGLSDLATRDALARLRTDGVLEATCVMVVDTLVPNRLPGATGQEHDHAPAHPVDLRLLLTLVDGLATAQLARAGA